MPSASFLFGVNNAHEIKVECGYFGGEKYFVDGVLALSHWSLRPSGVRKFSAHGHDIEIRVSVNHKAARAEALVDGKVVAENLFASFNAKVARHRGGSPWLVKVAVWFVVALAIFWGLKFFERRPNSSIERTDSSALPAAAYS